MADSERVLIVGGGPVGSVLALALRQQGIPVLLVEALATPERECRAASCHPPTIAMLETLGLLDAGIAQGLVSPVFHYLDRVTGKRVGRFAIAEMQEPPRHAYVLQWEQYKIAETIVERLASDPDAEIRLSTRLTAIEQTADGITAMLTGADGTEEKVEAAYLVGCDGGRSTVRKLLGIDFDGYTWPERFLKIDTRYDFAALGDAITNRNYFSDPEEWMNLFKARGDDGSGMWRSVSPAKPGQPDDELTSPEAMEARLQRFCPKPGRYEIVTASLYAVHQRIAATFNQGRVLLAGDAAHVNNPVGGMGMNGGIHDAVNLAAKLAAIRAGGDADALLGRYTRQRRKAQVDGVQAQSVANKQLLGESDPVIRAARLDEIRRAAGTPALHDAFIRRSCMIDSLAAAEATP